MRFTKGWIKLHRSLAEKEIVDNPFLFSLWVYLLLVANYKESKIIWKGEQRTLEPGQALITLRELADKWECSPTTIWKWLHYLEKSERIVNESRTHGTIVTICNWKEYQLLEEEARTPSEHEVNTARTPSEHEVNNSKEEVPSKKERRKEGKNNSPGFRQEYSPEFNQLWIEYSRKGDKKASWVEFQKLKLNPDDYPRLEQAIKNYCHENPDKKFRKDFERFLKTDWRESLTLRIVQSGVDWSNVKLEEAP